MQLLGKRPLGILLAIIFAVPTSLIATSPAYADEGAAEIIMEQAPTKIDSPQDPSGKPSSGPCSQALPANPIVICGYAKFSDVMPTGYFKDSPINRKVTGLPPEFWDKNTQPMTYNWKQEGGSFVYAHHVAKDLAYAGAEPVQFRTLSREVGFNALYFSKGVYWRDTEYWRELRSPPKISYTTVSPGFAKWIPPVVQPRQWVSAKRDRNGRVTSPGYWIPAKTIKPGYWQQPTPITVATAIITKDETKQRRLGPVQYATCTSGTCTYRVQRLEFEIIWENRFVTFSGVTYHKAPETIEVWCQTELGPGKLKGPYDHNGKPLNSQIGYNKTDLDPQTTLRQWWTKPPDSDAKFTRKAPGGGFIKLSNIGERYEKAKGIFSRGNPQALALVTRCIQDKPAYIADAAKQPCIIMEPSSPFYGRELPASHELCQAFVPGNYEKDLRQSKEMKCIYTKRSWVGLPVNNLFGYQDPFKLGGSAVLVGKPTSSAKGFNPITFIHCDYPIEAGDNTERAQSPNAIDYPITRAFWACEGDSPESGNKRWHPDRNYDFLTCGYTFACVVPGGDDRPTITDVNSNTSARSSSQVLASGAQIKVSWQLPTGIAVYNKQGRLMETVRPDTDKAWQQWRVLDGSTPWYSAKNQNDKTQPTFGSNIINSSPDSTVSLLNSGKNGWNTPDMYIRGYKGTDVASTTRRVGDVLVRQGELIPFALDTEYNATIPKDMFVFGRPITINQPVRCTMPPAYLYFLSGRATG